jgi:ABC-type Zn uptake system ZnuABC Zn-binding protein ZnuA
MTDLRRLAVLSIPVLILGAALTSCGDDDDDDGDASATEIATETAEPDRIAVVTTVAPITNIAENIGGERVSIEGIVPEGVSSHEFEPAPSEAARLARAEIIFVNGLHLEEPTIELAEANKQEGVEIIFLGENTITEDEWKFDFSFPEEEGDPNPHLWPNYQYALRYAEIIKDELSALDPEGADYYQANYDDFAERMTALDEATRTATETVPPENRKLLTYHDSWAYWAPVYGFEVIGAIQPSDFGEPSAQDVADLIDQINAEGVPAIFGSEVYPSPVLEQIADETGAEYVDDLRDDDLPGEPGDAEHSYIGLMVQNMEIMIPALGGDASAMESVDTSNVSAGADAEYPQ